MEERVQKIMAQAGYGSRRSCEELIAAGRVKVNGKIAILGTKADPEKDLVQVDEQPIPKSQQKRYIALHKPRGVLSDSDPNDPRPTVLDMVPAFGHIFAVGRLDFDSEGLILLTNDGELANRLTHPRYGHEKEYRVLTANRPDEEQLSIWRRGVVLEDGYRTAPAQVIVDNSATKGTWLRVVLNEGRKRQIREVGSRIGLPVHRIIRVRIGTLLLGDLKPGEWRNLTMAEVRSLKELQGQAKRPRRPTSSAYPNRKVFSKPRTRAPLNENQPDTMDMGRPVDKRPSHGYPANEPGAVADTRPPRRRQSVEAGYTNRRVSASRRTPYRNQDTEFKPEGFAGNHEERSNSRFSKTDMNRSQSTGTDAPRSTSRYKNRPAVDQNQQDTPRRTQSGSSRPTNFDRSSKTGTDTPRPTGRYKSRPAVDQNQQDTPKPEQSRSSRPTDFNRRSSTGTDTPRPVGGYKNRPSGDRSQQNSAKPAHTGTSRPNEFHPGSADRRGGARPIRRRRP